MRCLAGSTADLLSDNTDSKHQCETKAQYLSNEKYNCSWIDKKVVKKKKFSLEKELSADDALFIIFF